METHKQKLRTEKVKILNRRIYAPKLRIKAEAPFLFAGGFRTFGRIEDGLMLGLSSEGKTAQAALVDSKGKVAGKFVSPEAGRKNLNHHMEWLPKVALEAVESAKKMKTKLSAVSVQLGPGEEASLMIGLKFAKVSPLCFNFQRKSQESSKFR